jgi:hypothetical protein
MYYQNGVSLGTYSNLPTTTNSSVIQISEVTTGEEDFGLDFYEPKFFHPLGDWLSYGKFEIVLRFDVDDYDKDLFYFCHVSYPQENSVRKECNVFISLLISRSRSSRRSINS